MKIISIIDCPQASQIGNGICNEEMNKAECDFDGGDCCAACDEITITLENNVLLAQGLHEGIYNISSMVNGKPSWTSMLNGIWYVSEHSLWMIGALDYIGQPTGGLYNLQADKCPFNVPSEMWIYYSNGWMYSGANETNVHCSA